MSVNIISNSNFPVKSYYPNFRSEQVTLPPQKPDTVEISAKNKKQKEGMSTGMKWLLGLTGTATVVYAGLVGHRAFSRPTLELLQKDFKEIFRREVSKEEIPNILQNYKEIMKIENDKEFCEKAFEQVKKDYGYEKLDIIPTLSEETNTIFGGQWIISGEAFLLFYKNIIKLFGGEFNKITKAKILDSIFHEFQHVKQTEYCMRTNPEKFFDAILSEKVINQRLIEQSEKVLNDEKALEYVANTQGITKEQYRQILQQELAIIKEKGYKSLPEVERLMGEKLRLIKSHLYDLFGGMEKFKPDTQEYELGEQYIKNFKDYKAAELNSDNKEYLNQLVEKEAFKAEGLSLDIPKRLKSIWNIFDNTNYDKLKLKES